MVIDKPLAYFAVLWVVFGRIFKIDGDRELPALPAIGIVLYMFFVDATGLAFPSMTKSGAMLRNLAFPPIVIPVSVSVTARITFGVNLVAVAVFVRERRSTDWDWLLVVPLLAELYAFILGVGLILATLFVRFRDVSQLWELGPQLLMFASPIMYPITILPTGRRRSYL